MKWFYSLFYLLILQSCASVSFIKKHHLKVEELKTLTIETYHINDDIKILEKKTDHTFTKNGRVKFAQTYNKNDDLIITKEKKLWFTKESFPDKEPYYCKTRWKPNNRERISCYSQKQYKQNEAIYYYNQNGSINKIEDNFITFYTRYYFYNSTGSLSKIEIKDKNGNQIDEIMVKCLEADNKGLCTLQQRINRQDHITEIVFKPTYTH